VEVKEMIETSNKLGGLITVGKWVATIACTLFLAGMAWSSLNTRVTVIDERGSTYNNQIQEKQQKQIDDLKDVIKPALARIEEKITSHIESSKGANR
jgi:hypothetical protein